MAKTIRLSSECDNDGKLYVVTDEQYAKLKGISPDQDEWPDELNPLLDEICKEENEVKFDGDICTVGDCWGFSEGDEQVWGI